MAPVLVDTTEPRAIAAELLARSPRSESVSTVCTLLVAKAPAATIERMFAWVEHYLLHDADRMQQDTLTEPTAACPMTLTACFESPPHGSWAEQAPASAGRAYTALCLSRLERQRATVRCWLLPGEAADGQGFTQAVLRQDVSVAEQARLMLQCGPDNASDVDPMVSYLRESGRDELVSHLVDAAAEELARLRPCRVRVEATGWVRQFMRRELDAAEEMLKALAAVVS